MTTQTTDPAVDVGGDQADPTALPVAEAAAVRRHVWVLAARRKRMLSVTILWFLLATVCGLAVPALIGALVGEVEQGTTARQVDLLIAAIAVFLVAQTLLTRVSRLHAARFGEETLADLREEFIDRSLALPQSTLERAGTGDLLTRATRDINVLSNAVRMGVPAILTAVLTVLLTLTALIIVSPLMALSCLVAVPVIGVGTRWYLQRARAAYLRQSASYSHLTEGLSETVTGARTVEALALEERRRDRAHTDIARSAAAQKATLRLRTVWFPQVDIGYSLPMIAVLLVGGYFYTQDWVSLGEVTAAVLYTRALIDPLDLLLSWLDELQMGAASLARLIGVGEVGTDETERSDQPSSDRLVLRDVSYAYREGHDVLRGVDLEIEPGERLAIVGPSGAGKSTLGRIMTGIHTPTRGSVTVGGVDLTSLPLEERRRALALVTQEHHVFGGTIADNVSLARPDATPEEILATLETVGAAGWVAELPDGMNTAVGGGQQALTPQQAQQIALARLAIADPHTLVLDEATSLLDPTFARDLERSLSALMQGRTVISIAHRLHTAHDSDRIAVMEDGVITELGSHSELLNRGGTYAQLWRSWSGT